MSYIANVLQRPSKGWGTACDFLSTSFCWKVFVIRLLYKTFKEELKIQGHHLLKLGFGFTTTCVMIVYENVMKFGTNYSRNGGQIIDFLAFCQFIP